MNQIATARRKPPPIAATLDLTNERERQVHDIIRNTHTGRSPCWRSYAMHRAGDMIIEIAEWASARRTVESRRFNVLTWNWDRSTVGVTWQSKHLTRAEALALFVEVKRGAAQPAATVVGLRVPG